jgi:alanyl aminopeptidase
VDKLIVLTVFSLTALAGTPTRPAFRLPDDVIPLKHSIELSIDPSLPTFEGKSIIDVDLRKATTLIWVNGRNLILREAMVSFGERMWPARVEAVGGELLGIHLDSAVGPGRATISIAYQGRLEERQVLGAYRRKVDGEWYVYTTFTPIEARRAFPCFDEPRFKTPWEMTIRAPQGNRAFSNAKEQTETQGSHGWSTIHFATTPPLPSEVVAFAVGPFAIYEGEPAGMGTAVRVITPRSRATEGKAAAQATVDVLPKLEAYTDIPYPFGKLDHVALAESAFGAVENPGLITYVSRELLVPPGTENTARIANLRFLQAHEIGHQWFGDMVTQATWADVWLSEGIATWISEKMMDQEQIPERKHLYAIAARERIIKVDESPRTRPVRVEVHDREGSKDVYNRIVYDKGASVLLMLEGWLGSDKTQTAFRAYLNEHRFGNATTADLAVDLKRASGIDPSAVMHAFLDTTGIPKVSGRVKCDETARIEIKAAGPTPVPVCWRSSSGSAQCTVMDAPSREVRLPSCPAWTYLNSGGTGYYRTVWTAEQLTGLQIESLTAAERLTLAYDLRAQATDRPAAHAALMKLAADPESEVAGAAKAGLK